MVLGRLLPIPSKISMNTTFFQEYHNNNNSLSNNSNKSLSNISGVYLPWLWNCPLQMVIDSVWLLLFSFFI